MMTIDQNTKKYYPYLEPRENYYFASDFLKRVLLIQFATVPTNVLTGGGGFGGGGEGDSTVSSSHISLKGQWQGIFDLKFFLQFIFPDNSISAIFSDNCKNICNSAAERVRGGRYGIS